MEAVPGVDDESGSHCEEKTGLHPTKNEINAVANTNTKPRLTKINMVSKSSSYLCEVAVVVIGFTLEFAIEFDAGAA